MEKRHYERFLLLAAGCDCVSSVAEVGAIRLIRMR